MKCNLSSASKIKFRYKCIEGVNVFYRESGDVGNPVVILLHGYPSSSRMYEQLIPYLALDYHVIAPDYPGFGLSDAPSVDDYDYTFDNISNTINKLIDGLNIKKFVLFMQDYGGPIGFRIAINNPDKISGLIIQNANSYAEGLGVKWKGLAKYWDDPILFKDNIEGFLSYEGAKQRHLGNTPNPEKYNPEYWLDEFNMLSKEGYKEIQSRLFFDYKKNVDAYPIWQKWLRDNTPPTLILWGKYDPSFIVEGAKSYLNDVPNAELHLLDAGHFALDEATDEVADLTIKFLKSISDSQ